MSEADPIGGAGPQAATMRSALRVLGAILALSCLAPLLVLAVEAMMLGLGVGGLAETLRQYREASNLQDVMGGGYQFESAGDRYLMMQLTVHGPIALILVTGLYVALVGRRYWWHCLVLVAPLAAYRDRKSVV